MTTDDLDSIFGGNLQSGSQVFQSGLNSGDPSVKSNPANS